METMIIHNVFLEKVYGIGRWEAFINTSEGNKTFEMNIGRIDVRNMVDIHPSQWNDDNYKATLRCKKDKKYGKRNIYGEYENIEDNDEKECFVVFDDAVKWLVDKAKEKENDSQA